MGKEDNKFSDRVKKFQLREETRQALASEFLETVLIPKLAEEKVEEKVDLSALLKEFQAEQQKLEVHLNLTHIRNEVSARIVEKFDPRGLDPGLLVKAYFRIVKVL